ncbi:MAG: nucleoid-associated protein [Bacteroidales bacterium]|nr:nucleoid-associated protein [Bacteroidales bacterium]
MFYFEESELEHLIVHKTGNKSQNEELLLSEEEVNIDESLKDVLVSYFFNSFKEGVFYQFAEESLPENKIFQSAKIIFENENELVDESKKIAYHLYEQSYHPKIKSGELYVGLFRNCIIEDEVVDALGIFKSETKQAFLKVYSQDNNIQLNHDTGININKIDKACLIFNTEEESGYKVAIIDVSGKSKEAHYWKDDFLAIEKRKDDYYQTANYIGICKGFVKDVYNQSNGVERADQIEMLNKTAEYFKEKEEFDIQDFEQNVIENDEVIKAFEEYKEKVAEENDLEILDNFGISETAVKKSRAQFKSVLKLDKNFHIYIHGDRQRIIKGYDPTKGMNYYQIYFEKEN